MKVLIVSGFLGAGKTSFIRHMTDTLLDVDFVIFENWRNGYRCQGPPGGGTEPERL